MSTRKTSISGAYLLLAILTACSAGAFYLSNALTAKSDIFYLHYLGYRTFEPVAAERALEREAANSTEQSQELQRREFSARNYPISTLSHYAGAQLFSGRLAWAIAFGLGLPFCIGLAVAAAGLLRLPDMYAPFALSIAVMALVAFLPGPGATDNLNFHGGIDNLLNIAVLIINPGEAFSPLSVWPKSSLALILIAALANRWSGRFGIAYMLLIAALPFHLTLGGLVLLAFVIMDVVLRPKRVHPFFFAAAVIAALAALASGQWKIAAGDQLGLVIGVIMAGSIAGLLIARGYQKHYRLTQTTMAADGVAFVLAALFFTPAAMGIVWMTGTDQAVSEPQSVFPQLAARLIVLAVTVLLFAASVQAVRWLRERGAENAVAVIAGLVCLITLYGAAGSWWWQSRYLPDRIHETAARSQTEPLTHVYYRALQALGSGQDRQQRPR